jgi:hypothetical protein
LGKIGVDTLLLRTRERLIFCFMQRTISFSPVPPSELDVNPSIDVVIAYEDFETGKHAKSTYDFLVEHLGQECQFTNQMWKFDVLGIANLRQMAAKDAAQADIVIISCHERELPSEVKAWIELWLAEASHPIALVALIAPCDPSPTGTTPLRSYLTAVAQRGGMELFLQPEEWPGKQPEQGFMFRRGQDKTLSILAGAIDHDHNRFPRWGINE